MRNTQFAKRSSFALSIVLICAGPVAAQDNPFTLRGVVGQANAGLLVDKDAGGNFSLDADATTALGVGVVYALAAPKEGAGFRSDLVGTAFWHRIRATGTDPDLGTVTLENDWSASATARLGYDFGSIYPYASIGLGMNDLSVGTNGASPKDRIGIGQAVGLGVEAKLANGWSAQGEILANIPVDFDPAGGGGTVSAGTIAAFLGVSTNF